MNLEQVIFEQFLSAQKLLKLDKIYAANTLLGACYDCLKKIHGEVKLKNMNNFKACITENTYDEEKKLYEEMKKKNPNLTYKEFTEKEELVKELLVKEFFKDVKFKEFPKNHEVYIKSKHGFTTEENTLNLTKNDVIEFEKFIRYILVMLYKDDLLEYKKVYF